MAEIKLFSLNEGVKECTSSEVILEKELQTLIEQNMEIFFGVRFLKSEYVVTNGRMDSIGIDENNSPVIFEYKRSQNENVINQGLFYLDWLLDHKADFKLLVIDKLGKEAADNIDWSVPCVICVAHDFTKYDMLLSCKLDAPAPCRLDAPDFSFVCHVLADCLHQHWQAI